MNIIETDWKWNGELLYRSSTDYIVLHHAQAVHCTAQQIDDWHKSNGWSGIGYHFFVRKNGEIYRGRPLWSVGSHVLHMNNCSIGICAEGDYHDKDKVMPYAQKRSIKELVIYLKGIYHDAKIVGHKEIGDSNCPGKYYPLEEMKKYSYTEQEDEPMTADEKKEFAELKAMLNNVADKQKAIDESLSNLYEIVKAIKKPMIYNYIDENMPEWAREGVQWCVDNGIITGTGDGLGLDDKDLKYCTMIMRIVKKLDK